jgi:spore maturation protein CgeB
MRILMVTPSWIGGLFDYIYDEFNKENEVEKLSFNPDRSFLEKIKLHNIIQVKDFITKKRWEKFNQEVIEKLKLFKPELFISFNESFLFSSTIEEIQKHKCFTINFVSDNPFDPLRFSFYPVSLKYYHLIFVFDKIWMHQIGNIAKESKIIKLISGGGFNKKIFYPINLQDITEEEKQILNCDISFTGESYNMRGEAGYRADIMDYLGNYNVKIWGDGGWKKRFHLYKNIERYYQGGRLSYDMLRKLYAVSTINLNMPSPQIFTGFQPRTFEIAACKGFQIADWREELDEVFTDEELVTFKSIPDLIEKIDFFTKNPEKRLPFMEKAYKKVIEKHSWDIRIKEIMKIIKDSQ